MNLCFLRPACLPLLILSHVGLSQTGVPDGSHAELPASRFQYRRAVKLAAEGREEQACAVLDAPVFAHAAASLKDLRLYSGLKEVPFATTLSEPLEQETEDARILNLRSRSGHILFDLEMPQRTYSGLVLDLAARDFIGKALVSGSVSQDGKDATQLGTFTLFDLTSQHLSHSTSIPLSESTFPYLHLDLSLTAAPGSAATAASLNLPGIVKAATVPPSREAQSLYTTTQRATVVQKGQETVATFNAQSRIPIERIAFTLPVESARSFSRSVRIEAHAKADGTVDSQGNLKNDEVPFGVETVTGTILRVHRTEGGHPLSAESLSIPVSIGSNMQQPAVVTVRVEDGSEPSLPLSVELQMRQRKICFDPRSASAPLVLFYGNASLDAPAYTEAALKQAATHPGLAELGPETENPAFAAPAAPRSFTRHRPILRWIALLGCVCIFALLVIRRSHRARH